VQSITIQDLQILSRECLEDAKALYSQKRYRGAIYNCGYAVEIGLKMKICKTLDWNEYRTDSKYKALKTHELDFLLHLYRTPVKTSLLSCVKVPAVERS
jgi:HEPN domain-containing protein